MDELTSASGRWGITGKTVPPGGCRPSEGVQRRLSIGRSRAAVGQAGTAGRHRAYPEEEEGDGGQRYRRARGRSSQLMRLTEIPQYGSPKFPMWTSRWSRSAPPR